MDLCKGAAWCEQVCPRGCFKVQAKGHVATMPGADRCVQCGACIVQCPIDALCFTDAEGRAIPPEAVRRFKLNLMGQRVEAAGNEGSS
jgi:Fe-S-cluster-containing hydrogenase component 2